MLEYSKATPYTQPDQKSIFLGEKFRESAYKRYPAWQMDTNEPAAHLVCVIMAEKHINKAINQDQRNT